MKIVTQPRVYLVGRTQLDEAAVQQFLDDEATNWSTDGERGSELLSELAGRVCYMSFGEKQGRRSNRDYLMNIISMEHGSVLEHAVWNFIVTGVSRSFSHELIRHRAGWGYCLAGDTVVYSEHFGEERKGGPGPDGMRNRRNGTKKRRLEDLYVAAQTPHGRSRLRLMKVRCLDEVTGYFTTTHVRRVAQSGIKALFRVTLEDGKKITCSKDHRFLTFEGWASLEDIVGGIAVTSRGTVTWGDRGAIIMVNGEPAYRNKVWLEEVYHGRGLSQKAIATLGGTSSHTIRAWVRKHQLQKPAGSWTIGRIPWNKGRRYQAGWSHSAETRELLSMQKRGERNPQWRGGITPEIHRRRIAACEQYRSYILERDQFTCRLCMTRHRNNTLQVHHIVPIWARPDLVSDPTNMAALCVPCHSIVTGQELDYAEQLGRSLREFPADAVPRTAVPSVLVARGRRIVNIEYVGEQMTYDLEVDGPNHNFVANGIVTHNSQLSQRYVDESDTDFVEPKIIASDPELHSLWQQSIEQSHQTYCRLADGLLAKIEREHPELKGRDRRKKAREAARSVLPNATETKILVSANARALRHFVEYRGAPDAEPEIRRVAMAILEIMRREAPNLFSDYDTENLYDGSTTASTVHKKV